MAACWTQMMWIAYCSSTFSTAIVQSVIRAAAAPSAAHIGSSTTPTTPTVSGNSSKVLPPSVFMLMRRIISFVYDLLDFMNQFVTAHLIFFNPDLFFSHHHSPCMLFGNRPDPLVPGDHPNGMDKPGNVTQYREQDVEPELPTNTHLQENS
jgi:hypothetical protein